MRRIRLTVVIALLGAAGCVSDEVMVVPRPPAHYERMGGTDGEACGALVLGFIPIEMTTRLQRAQAGALQKKPGASGLINAELSSEWIWWFFGTTHCTSIEGEAIREVATP